MRTLMVVAVLAALILLGGFLSFAFMDIDVPQKDVSVELQVPQAAQPAAEAAPAFTLNEGPAPATPGALNDSASAPAAAQGDE